MPSEAPSNVLGIQRNGYLKSTRMLYEVVEIQQDGALLRNCITEGVQFWPNGALIELEEVIPEIGADVDSLR